MKKLMKHFGWFLIFFLCFTQTSKALDSHEALGFVKDFYQTYHFPNQNPPNYREVLQHKSNAFSTDLFSALKTDEEAQKNSKAQVGLDFDPFLNGQDPAENYKVGQLKQKGKSTWVEMYEIRAKKKSENPILWVELQMQDGKWKILNFHYAENGKPREGYDLLSTLKQLALDRSKSANKKK